MSEHKMSKAHDENGAALVREWRDRLLELTTTVKGWAEEFGWSTRLISKQMKESRLGSYDAPSLLIQKETTRIILDPVARFAPGTDGIVNLYLMPAYDDIARICFVDGQWRWHDFASFDPGATTVPITEARLLSKETLAHALDEMIAHAAKSL